MKTTDAPVIVEQVFNNAVEVVWRAITERNEMIAWFFDNIPDFKAEVGFKTQFDVQAPSRNFMHLWHVVEVIPLSKIVVNWKYGNFAGDSFVTMKLEDMGDKTKLTLTTKVTEDFDDAIPEFKRENCVAGWNYFIREQLTNYLQSKTA